MRDLIKIRPAQMPTAIGSFTLDRRIHNRPVWILSGLVIIGAILRLYLLADKNIWLDEAYSISLSQQKLGDLLRLVVESDVHPPLYYLLLKLWLVPGDSAGYVRLLSVIFSIAAIPLMYLVVSTLYDDVQAGLIGAGILAFSPLHIWYAQEARMYALLTFFVLASAYFFIRALRQGLPRDWIAYIFTTTLALYTDYAAIWYFVVMTIFYLLSWKRFPNRTKAWLLSQAAVLLIFSPWFRPLLTQMAQVTDSFWLPPPTFQTILDVFLDFNSLNFPWIAMSVLYMTVIFVWVYIVPDNSWQLRLATIWLLIPLAIALILSFRQPIFLSRNLIIASIGYYLLVVGAIKRFKSVRWMGLLLLPLLVMNMISIAHNAWDEEKENWRDLAAHVAALVQNSRDGLIIFNPPYAEIPFAYYFQGYDLDVDTQGYPQDEILHHPQPKQVDDLGDLLLGRPYVWLVLRNDAAADLESPVKEWLDTNGYVRGGDFYRDGISVLGYTRWDILADRPPPSQRLARADAGTKIYFPVAFHATAFEVETAVYIVQRGDTLSAIARRFGTTVDALVSTNNITNPNSISVGQELIVP